MEQDAHIHAHTHTDHIRTPYIHCEGRRAEERTRKRDGQQMKR